MFNVCWCYFSGQPSAGWGIWNWVWLRGLPRPCEAHLLESSSVWMYMDVCVSACLSRDLERMSVRSVDGLSGVSQDTWDNNGMKCRLLFKVYRAVRSVYSSVAAGEGYKERGVKRWIRKMVKFEEGESLERQRKRGVHTVNRKMSELIFINRQIPLWPNWYWGL